MKILSSSVWINLPRFGEWGGLFTIRQLYIGIFALKKTSIIKTIHLLLLFYFFFGIASAQVGIGTTTPQEQLEVSGAIKIGTTATTNAGTIRWSGTDFEGYDGTNWISVTQKEESFNYPDGIENIQPVLHDFINGSYTVPSGKNLYITNLYSVAAGFLFHINSLVFKRGQEGINGYHGFANPIIAGPSDIIGCTNCSNISNLATFNGFLVDASVITMSHSNAAFTVPVGKILIILSTTTGVLFIDGVRVYNGSGNNAPSAGSFTPFLSPFIVAENQIVTNAVSSAVWNGYLVDK